MKRTLIFAAALLLALPSMALEGFTTDLNNALKRAAETKHSVLALFTGSDWCVWCQRLEAEVLSQPAFLAGATNDFELVCLDFPSDRSKQPAAERARNEELAKKYTIEGFPTVLILNEKGEELLRTGYGRGGAEKWLQDLRKKLVSAPAEKRLFAGIDAKEKELMTQLGPDMEAAQKSSEEEALQMAACLAVVRRYLPRMQALVDETRAIEAGAFSDLKEEKADRIERGVQFFRDLADRLEKRLEVLSAGPVEVPVTAHPTNNMHLVSAALNGVPCRVLVDTGATHSTFDLAFVTNHFPAAALHEVNIEGNTNVEAVPRLLEVKDFQVGDYRIMSMESAMVIPLGLEASVGERVDGILGMMELGNESVIIRDDALVFNPDADERDTFGAAQQLIFQHGRPTVSVMLKGEETSLLLDTGSTYTFLPKDLWPATTNTVSLAATEVNGTHAITPILGETGTLELGVPVTVTPRLVTEGPTCLGADILKSCDLYLKATDNVIRFRRR